MNTTAIRRRVLLAARLAGWAIASCLACGVHAHPSQPSAQTRATSQASSEAPFDLAVPRHVIAGGGDTSSGGAYTISGTIGQPDADPLQPSTGGSYAIAGGFWPGVVAPAGDPLFANGFEGP